jgi:hypothetical protein
VDFSLTRNEPKEMLKKQWNIIFSIFIWYHQCRNTSGCWELFLPQKWTPTPKMQFLMVTSDPHPEPPSGSAPVLLVSRHDSLFSPKCTYAVNDWLDTGVSACSPIFGLPIIFEYCFWCIDAVYSLVILYIYTCV